LNPLPLEKDLKTFATGQNQFLTCLNKFIDDTKNDTPVNDPLGDFA